MQDLFMLDVAVAEHQQRLRTATRGLPVTVSPSHPVRVWVGQRLIALGGVLAGATPELPELSEAAADPVTLALRSTA